jgi:hypothetical protein
MTGPTGPTGAQHTGYTGKTGPTGTTGIQQYRLTAIDVSINAGYSGSSTTVDLTDLPYSSSSFVSLAGYVFKQYRPMTKGIKNIYVHPPVGDSTYWQVTIDLVNYPYNNGVLLTVFVFAFLNNSNLADPGLGTGVPTDSITTTVYSS